MSRRVQSRRERRRIAAAWILSIALASAVFGCATEPRTTGAVALSTPLRSPDDKVLPDFGVVEPGQLYRGGQPGTLLESRQEDGYEILVRQYKVRTIVDLTNQPIDHWIMGRRADCTRMPPALRGQLNYVAIPAIEWHPSRANLIKFLGVFQDPANRPVFLHCSAGENRTGAMVAGFRVIEQSWQPAAAKKEMRGFHVARFWTLVNDRFIDGLLEDRAALLTEVAAANARNAAIVTCDEHQRAAPLDR